ncbi:MAG: TetR/AcrR family transcriptional regulator [Flexilinea sp.]|nr:TetR/AcrR family transcriptional regulator [Flexilinea sp.]
MPPKVKFQKEDFVTAGLNVVREKGNDALTAREVAARLGVSTRPIFTYYDTMDQLKQDVFEMAEEQYRDYIEQGLTRPIPFLGVWQQYLHFAKEEPELYRLLFLDGKDGVPGGAIAILQYSQDLVRDSVMHFYNMDAYTADCFFRDLWLTAFSFAALIVTDNCPFSFEEMIAVGAEISLSVCKAYKEIPGLAEGKYDRDEIFTELVKK